MSTMKTVCGDCGETHKGVEKGRHQLRTGHNNWEYPQPKLVTKTVGKEKQMERMGDTETGRKLLLASARANRNAQLAHNVNEIFNDRRGEK